MTAPKLSKGAVVNAALGAASVTFDKLDPLAVAQIEQAVTHSLSVLGEVDERGEIVRGSGFTVSRTEEGGYTIVFEPKFAKVGQWNPPPQPSTPSAPVACSS